MNKLEKHYSHDEQTYPQWYDNEVLINADTTISSTMFGHSNKIYIIDTIINPSTETTFLVGNNSILKFTRNGQFGDNCIIDCATPLEIEAGMHKVFGAGTIKAILKNPTIYPEWWGAVGDGLTDDAPAINRCILAAHRNTVFLGQSFYRITSEPITIKETEGDTSRYEVLGLSYPTGTSETYWEWGGLSGVEEKRRKIIINGCLIGDESLVGPVIYIAGFVNSVLQVNGAIYVRSTSPSSAGIIQVGTLYSSKVYINSILKENNDRTEGATINHTGAGCGIILGQAASWSSIDITAIKGFEYGLVVTDKITAITFCPDFTPIQVPPKDQNTTAKIKGSGMINKIDIRFIDSVKYPVYFKYQVNASFFNCNVLHLGELGGNSTLDVADYGTGFTVQKPDDIHGFAANQITIDALDGYYKKVLDVQGMSKGTITIQGNIQDVFVNGKTDTNRAIQNLDSDLGKVFKFYNSHNVKVNTIGTAFAEAFDFTRCTGIQVSDVRFTETTNKSDTSEIGNGSTLIDKAKFDAELSIVEDGGIETYAIPETSTSALIVTPKPRYKGHIHYVATLPTALTKTNHQFYALTSTEYGDVIKLYKLYDSLGREVGYVYKDN